MLKLALALSLLLLPDLAWADVIPPEVASCEKLKEGDACTLLDSNKAGRCEQGERCGLNYACDGGGAAPCGTSCSPALVCKETNEPEPKDEGGCSLAAVQSADLYLGGLLVGLGLLVVLARRRR